MTSAERLGLTSASEYLARELVSEVRHEYVGGHVYPWPGGTTTHSRVAGAICGLLDTRIRGNPCESFSCGMKIRVKTPKDIRFYYPDAMVVCRPKPSESEFQDEPVVIAEVLSEATRRIDEVEKRDAYLTIPTLMAYLLVETEVPRVVVDRRAKAEDRFDTEVYDGLDAMVPLPAIGAELRLADLYARVKFKYEAGATA
jgi:Uma2 family endonuclease